MAAVFNAHHLLLNEPCALKVINLELARDQQFVERFKNEAIITRKLQHPNAVRMDDLDIAEDGRPFIAMELVEGESLRSRMLRSGPLPLAEVLDVALQVCAALEAARGLGLIHRDIKPDNIVLVPREGATPLAKILDFGIARLREASPSAAGAHKTLTGTGVVIGTADYMSPEQPRGMHGGSISKKKCAGLMRPPHGPSQAVTTLPRQGRFGKSWRSTQRIEGRVLASAFAPNWPSVSVALPADRSLSPFGKGSCLCDSIHTCGEKYDFSLRVVAASWSGDV